MAETDVLSELVDNRAFASLIEVYQTATGVDLLPSILAAASSINPDAASMLTAEGIPLDDSSSAIATAETSDEYLPTATPTASVPTTSAFNTDLALVSQTLSGITTLGSSSSNVALPTSTGAQISAVESPQAPSGFLTTLTPQDTTTGSESSILTLSQAGLTEDSTSMTRDTESGQAIATANGFLTPIQSISMSNSWVPTDSQVLESSSSASLQLISKATSATEGTYSSDAPLGADAKSSYSSVPSEILGNTHATGTSSANTSTPNTTIPTNLHGSSTIGLQFQSGYESAASTFTSIPGDNNYPQLQTSTSSYNAIPPLLSNNGIQNNLSMSVLLLLALTQLF